MTTKDAKVGMRVYNRYRDLFGVIISFGSDEEGTYAKVKYEWPVDPNAEPYKDPIYRLEPDFSTF